MTYKLGICSDIVVTILVLYCVIVVKYVQKPTEFMKRIMQLLKSKLYI